LQRVQQHPPLSNPPHQRQVRQIAQQRRWRRCHRQMRRCGLVQRSREIARNLLAQGHRRVTRSQAYLRVQHSPQHDELLQRGLRTPQEVIELHQLAVRLLAQRVGGCQALGVGERLLVAPPLLVQSDQPLQHLEEKLPQPFPLQQRPIVVDTLQKVGAIQISSRAQLE
jgi:hypothetical protein